MSISTVDGALRVRGQLTCDAFVLPASSVVDASVSPSAAIVAEKLEHQYMPMFAQANTTAAAETRAIHVVRGLTGTLEAFRAGVIGACTGNATITVDCRKNGTTILSAAVVLDSTNLARIVEAGTLSVSSLAVGDVLEVVVTVNAGSGALGTGLFAQICLREVAD